MSKRDRRPVDECENLVQDRSGYQFIGRPDRARYRGNRCDGFEVGLQDIRRAPSAEFRAPAPETNQPPLLVVESPELSRACEDRFPGQDRLGDPVTIVSGTFIRAWDWRAIPDVAPDRLNWLSEQSTSFRGQVLDHAAEDRETGVGLIRNQYLLKLAQAEWVWDTLNTIFDQLDEFNLVAANTALDCYWENEEQTAVCDDTVRAAVSPNSVTVVAGELRSYTSQADADARALALAQSQLDCLYPNAEQVVDCQTDLDFPDLVPTGADPDFGQVGEVTVAAGEILDRDPDQADARAQALARSQLRCFYVNEELELDCYELHDLPKVDPDPLPEPVPGEVPYTPGDWELRDYGQADVEARIPGSTVLIAAGQVQSPDSRAQAQDLARLLAESLLRCEWGNNAYTALCPPVYEDEEDSEAQVWEPNQAQSEAAGGPQAFTNTVAADTFTSPAPDGSKQEANDQAKLYADAQLFCIYCNNQVAARCVTEKDGEPSYDKTETIAADSFCSTDPVIAQLQAEALANIPVRVLAAPENLCRYGNRQITARCSSTGGSGVYNKISWTSQGGQYLSPSSLAQEVVVPANTFFVVEDTGTDGRNAQQEADHLATQVAIASLDCYWENDRVVSGTCDGNGEPSTEVRFPWYGVVTSVNEAGGQRSVHSVGVRIGPPGAEWYPVVVLIDRAYDLDVSINQQLAPPPGDNLIASIHPSKGPFDCADIECAPGTTLASAPGVEPGVFVSYQSKEDAQERARAMAQALAQCVPNDPFRVPDHTVVFGPWDNGYEVFRITGRRIELANPITPASLSGNTPRIYRIRITARARDAGHRATPFTHYLDESTLLTANDIPPINQSSPSDLEIEISEIPGSDDLHVTIPVYMVQQVSGAPQATVLNPSPTFAELEERGGGDGTHPWKVTVENGDVYIHPGSIGGVVPTNMFAARTVGAGLRFVVLDVSVSPTNSGVLSCSLSIGSTQPTPPVPTPAAPTSSFSDVIAVINDGAVFQVRSRNLNAFSQELFQETVEEPAIGERNYIPWYVWNVVEAI